MELKPPMVIAAIVATLVVLFGAYLMYDKGQRAGKRPSMTMEQYRGQHTGVPATAPK